MERVIFFRKQQNWEEEEILLPHEISHLKALRTFQAKKPFQIEFRNGLGKSYIYEFASGDKKGFRKEIISNSVIDENLIVAMAIPQAGKLEFWLQKGTELGISEFHFINMMHSDRKDLNLQRCEKILMESSSQCKRHLLPKIRVYKSLEMYLNSCFNVEFFYLHPYSQKPLIEKVWKTNEIPIIGPEGGFHEKELELFQKQNILGYSFGHNVLRMETAGISILSIQKYKRYEHGIFR
ncbi:MAG: 16S rRNA (uracil(1498)-N(3))-methyltransferase [Leptospiraceae bacterium]|nr:16S rRNA (uracil(1498)-N(3))-methyltransferase [Leptospiraceae bacterium]